MWNVNVETDTLSTFFEAALLNAQVIFILVLLDTAFTFLFNIFCQGSYLTFNIQAFNDSMGTFLHYLSTSRQ
jgi:hypothetical protein